ncbi:MAG: zinc-dependent peptidase [Marinicella sp.]|nr:zinc-dependent peptidase [Xanthomonadales bacterium]
MSTTQIGLLALVVFIVLAWLLFKWHKSQRRHKIYKLPTPERFVTYIEKNVAIYHFLPKPLKKELLGHVNVFLAEKYFSGHAGLEVTDEMRVTIAAQACLLLLNRKHDYFTHLRTIMVYPGGFKNPNHEGPGHHLGESWIRGPVVLSWNDAKHGGLNAKDGENVVIHEFAHQLDQADGAGDGRPFIDGGEIRTWGKVLSKEFQALTIKAKLKNRTFFNHYGATNPAEFFAVISEHFFEQPRTFKRKHPDLYQTLQTYYRLDPASWIEEHIKKE